MSLGTISKLILDGVVLQGGAYSKIDRKDNVKRDCHAKWLYH